MTPIFDGHVFYELGVRFMGLVWSRRKKLYESVQ